MKEGYIVIRLLPDQPYKYLRPIVGQPLLAEVYADGVMDVNVCTDATMTIHKDSEGSFFEVLSTNVGEFMEHYLRDAIQFVEQLAPVYFGDKQVTGANLILEKHKIKPDCAPTHFELVEE